MSSFPTIQQINETSLIVYFSDEIDINLTPRIAAVVDTINQWQDKTIIDLTPSYTSLLVNFNPLSISANDLIERIVPIIKQNPVNQALKKSRLIEIPVYYSQESGLDLEQVASETGLSVEQVIQLHSEPEYTVFALGFLPGYAFMGITDEKLRLPRLTTPRAKVPAGSVAIAEKQTGVYPVQTPGGWRLLGRSPMKLFDSDCNPPQPYQIGDKVKFNPISREEYLQLGGQL